mmetsp:Transcript_29241/g.83612  ORF Transcript_29241/g.83612 Transcript_29241/m.83612 type:complete len:202 (+) Transcript_29241:212-817(+)
MMTMSDRLRTSYTDRTSRDTWCNRRWTGRCPRGSVRRRRRWCWSRARQGWRRPASPREYPRARRRRRPRGRAPRRPGGELGSPWACAASPGPPRTPSRRRASRAASPSLPRPGSLASSRSPSCSRGSAFARPCSWPRAGPGWPRPSTPGGRPSPAAGRHSARRRRSCWRAPCRAHRCGCLRTSPRSSEPATASHPCPCQSR